MIINKKWPKVIQGEITYPTTSVYWNIYDFEDSNYWYIQFCDINCFSDSILDTVIPNSALYLIKNSFVKLVVNNAFEGMHSITECIYQRLIIDRGIPEDAIIFMSESYTIQDSVDKCAIRFNKKPIITYWPAVSEYSTSVQLNKLKNNDTEILSKKKYLSLNRRWRPHRPTLVGLLYARNLLDQGYVSLAKEMDRSWNSMLDWVIELNQSNEQLHKELLSRKDDLLSIPDLFLDVKDMEIGELSLIDPNMQKYYNSTYFSVVTETLFYQGKALEYNGFFSEKTFKPIAHKHPFILSSTPRSLKKLKELGYRTFHPYIDESYDSEENDSTRMLMIVNEVERLCKLPDVELQSLVESCIDVFEYNYKLLKARRYSKKRKFDK